MDYCLHTEPDGFRTGLTVERLNRLCSLTDLVRLGENLFPAEQRRKAADSRDRFAGLELVEQVVERGIVFALDRESYFFFIRIIYFELVGQRVKNLRVAELDSEIARHGL